MSGFIKLPDHEARLSALMELDRSLLVEAGAGSGKTSVMAGRIAMLLANGVEPKNIAAITFTEFAASELLSRIVRFVGALAKGKIPRDLEIAFPQGVSTSQRAAIAQAEKFIDQLACSTIHGFAQSLIKPYPVEAGIDPGADIIDPAEADLAFAESYDAWIRDRLSGVHSDEIIAELVVADEGSGLSLIHQVADFRRRNRDARPDCVEWSNSAIGKFAAAVAKFASEIDRTGFDEADTKQTSEDFVKLIDQMSGWSLDSAVPRCRDLVAVLTLPHPVSCFTSTGMRVLKTKGKWEQAAARAGKPKAQGSEAYQSVKALYVACHEAFNLLLAQTAGEVLARLSRSMDGLMVDWKAWKRDAALLDFDDLLYTARDLIRDHGEVRQSLSKRFRHVLVDEFQDTDPLQIELLWRLCGEGEGESPLGLKLRPGGLFLVGDPKQAIYRFRGADVNAYVSARVAIGEDSQRKITANFRSVEPIVTFVNGKFEAPLSAEASQPGFTNLTATCDAHPTAMAVAALDVLDGDKANANQMRDAEAIQVADLCRRLVGNRVVRGHDNTLRLCRLGDIALLAPVGTELWRFEEALEDFGIPVSTQAGKGFFKRQEIQDLIALTRTIADGRDTLALGAFLRGPLVGLTERELLDIADSLPESPDHPGRLAQLTIWTDPDQIQHENARSVIRTLRSLAMRSRSTTPYALLCDAVGLLQIRAQLRQRFKAGADRALANADMFLDMSRAYDVRGLRPFARDMRANWDEAARQVEGRPDAEEHSVALITVHASKGLEWPIVIPINMSGSPKSESGLMHDRNSDRFSIPVLGVEPDIYADIKGRNTAEIARERVRLWYVAATRARDLLVLPRHSADLPASAWAGIVDFGLATLPDIDPASLGEPMQSTPLPSENLQTPTIFADEAARVVESHRRIEWRQPSRHEKESSVEPRQERVFANGESIEEFAEVRPAVAGSAIRGTLLHKLLEEVLNNETGNGFAALIGRAGELLAQLGIVPSEKARDGISIAELAETVVRTLNLPEIAEMRSRLVPEFGVLASHQAEDRELIVSGIADAIAHDVDGSVDAVIDWKSDVMVDAGRLATYRDQLEAYRRETRAKRALLILMTPGTVINL